jgi:CheY-like chemotaxis protein
VANDQRSILVVDDDEEDRLLIEKAFRQNGVTSPIHFASGTI